MQYTLLFRIECRHGYFAGGPCRSLTLRPTESCRQLLDRYRMLFRSEIGGGAVYGLKELSPDLLKEFDEVAPLTFTLISSDPALANYTAVNPRKTNPVKTIFYFDNRVDYTEGNPSEPRQLHKPGEPLEHAAVPTRPKMYSVTSPRAVRFTINEPLAGQVVAQGVLAAKRPAQLDLRQLPQGLYLRQVNNKPARRFYLDNQLALRLWGAISIYPGGSRQASLVPENCRVIGSDGMIHPRTFTLALESRQTIWRYYIIPSLDDQDFSHYEVVTKPGTNGVNAKEIPFRLLPESLIDGRIAWIFESKSPLPLLLQPASAFSLSLRPNKNGKGSQKTIRLPYAQPVSMARNPGTDRGQMCSEIFVYV